MGTLNVQKIRKQYTLNKIPGDNVTIFLSIPENSTFCMVNKNLYFNNFAEYTE